MWIHIICVKYEYRWKINGHCFRINVKFCELCNVEAVIPIFQNYFNRYPRNFFSFSLSIDNKIQIVYTLRQWNRRNFITSKAACKRESKKVCWTTATMNEQLWFRKKLNRRKSVNERSEFEFCIPREWTTSPYLWWCTLDLRYACKRRDILRTMYLQDACRTPNCPSKCTYRSLSADPPTNKHWEIYNWYGTHAAIPSDRSLRLLSVR